MGYIEAMILGLVQGLCEFLPISSSGHLVLFGKLLNVQMPGILMETMLHVGTLAAVLLVYRQDIWAMIKNPLGKDVRLLVVATIPTVIGALLLGDLIDEVFSGGFLGISFLITTVILWISGRMNGKRTEMTYKDAGIMGGMQLVALLPGVSRSGSTIAGGLFAGLDRTQAARFSFLMSIPAILGSLVLQAKDLISGDVAVQSIAWGPLALGTLVAMGAGLLAIRFMLRVIRTSGLKWFAVYTLALGLLVTLDQYVTHLVF